MVRRIAGNDVVLFSASARIVRQAARERINNMVGGKPLIDFRQMLLEDIASVAAIEQLVNPSPWSLQQLQAELANPDSRFDLLIVGEAIAAYLCSWKIIDELEIQNVVTAPGFRRRGYAGKILEYVLRRAARENIAKVFLEVRVGNIAAKTLYEKFQFKTSGVRSKYYADNEDAVLMELELL